MRGRGTVVVQDAEQLPGTTDVEGVERCMKEWLWESDVLRSRYQPEVWHALAPVKLLSDPSVLSSLARALTSRFGATAPDSLALPSGATGANLAHLAVYLEEAWSLGVPGPWSFELHDLTDNAAHVHPRCARHFASLAYVAQSLARLPTALQVRKTTTLGAPEMPWVVKPPGTVDPVWNPPVARLRLAGPHAASDMVVSWCGQAFPGASVRAVVHAIDRWLALDECVEDEQMEWLLACVRGDDGRRLVLALLLHHLSLRPSASRRSPSPASGSSRASPSPSSVPASADVLNQLGAVMLKAATSCNECDVITLLHCRTICDHVTNARTPGQSLTASLANRVPGWSTRHFWQMMLWRDLARQFERRFADFDMVKGGGDQSGYSKAHAPFLRTMLCTFLVRLGSGRPRQYAFDFRDFVRTSCTEAGLSNEESQSVRTAVEPALVDSHGGGAGGGGGGGGGGSPTDRNRSSSAPASPMLVRTKKKGGRKGGEKKASKATLRRRRRQRKGATSEGPRAHQAVAVGVDAIYASEQVGARTRCPSLALGAMDLASGSDPTSSDYSRFVELIDAKESVRWDHARDPRRISLKRSGEPELCVPEVGQVFVSSWDVPGRTRINHSVRRDRDANA